MRLWVTRGIWGMVWFGTWAGVALGFGAEGDREGRFLEANRLYEAEEFEKARDVYEELSRENAAREVFFNLGNTYFRLGNLGKACLAFRRALLLDPGMVEANQNLRLLEKKLGSYEFRTGGMERALAVLSPGQWIGAALLGGWLVVLGAAGLLLYRIRQPWQGLVVAFMIFGALLAVAGGGAGTVAMRKDDLRRLAIVTRDDVVAQTGPFPDAKPVIALPPGSEVRIAADRDNWILVHIPNESAGWLRRESVDLLWPYAGRP